jgi:NTP pyrophosphatase (non-canonical NTP hydrolase)
MKNKLKPRFQKLSKYDKEILVIYSKWVESIWNWHPDKYKRQTFRDDYIMSLGLGGETGEVLEILKKKVRDNSQLDVNHLTEELGDVLYYLVKIANRNNIQLHDIMIKNWVKLENRYKKRQRIKRK